MIGSGGQSSYIGEGSLEKLGSILSHLGTRRIFLVTGKSSFDSSGAERLVQPLLKHYQVTLFSDVTANPRLEDIVPGIKKLADSKADTIIAIGGGSVIDTAKALNVFVSHRTKPQDLLKGTADITTSGRNVIAIPTTAGSGSEATHFAVIYSDGIKYSLAHASMLPQFAIVDPRLTYQLPPFVTATSGFDAFAQAIESYWSIYSTDESKKYAKHAIKLSLRNLEQSVYRPTKESRAAMAEAAHFAGRAINISKTTASHALSYPLTSHFGIPHGHAVGLTLSHVFRFNGRVSDSDNTDERGTAYVRKTMQELCTLLGTDNSDDAAKRINLMLLHVNLTDKLSSLVNFDITTLRKTISIERLNNNPRRMNGKDVELLYEKLR